MSEIKGTLLGIILAIGVFSIVFVFMTKAVEKASASVSERVQETVYVEADYDANLLN